MANLSTTPAQVVTALTQLRAEILATLVPGANLPGPALADLLVRQLDELVASINQRGQTRYGEGVPGPALGADNDVYTDTASGYEYQKVAGAWVFRLAKKGGAGTTPVKGTDYVDGEDGIDGTQVYFESYAPGPTTSGQEGFLWYHSRSLSAYDIYRYIDGQWILVFRKAEGSTTPAPSAITVTGLSPASALAGAGVTITGTNFTGATAVTFNGTAASFTVLNATTISATVPVGATTGKVLVATPAGSGQSLADFTVTAPAAPTVSALLNSNRIPLGQTLGVFITTTGTVTKVEVYEGQSLVASSTTSLTDLTWLPVSGPANRVVTVRAYNGTVFATSLPQALYVVDPANESSDLQVDLITGEFSFLRQTGTTAANFRAFINPNEGAIAPPTVTLSGASSIANNTLSPYTTTFTVGQGRTVTKVELLDGSTVYDTDTSAPYSFAFMSSVSGVHSLKARITDSSGAVGESAVLVVSVAAAGSGYTPPTGTFLHARRSDVSRLTVSNGRLDQVSSQYGLPGVLNRAATSTIGPLLRTSGLRGNPDVYFDNCGTLDCTEMTNTTGDLYAAFTVDMPTNLAFQAYLFGSSLGAADPKALAVATYYPAENAVWNNFGDRAFGPAVTFGPVLLEIMRIDGLGYFYVTPLSATTVSLEPTQAGVDALAGTSIPGLVFGSTRTGNNGVTAGMSAWVASYTIYTTAERNALLTEIKNG